MKTPLAVYILMPVLGVAACKDGAARKEEKRARARLRNVTSVTIKYLLHVSDKSRKTTVTLTHPDQIAKLISLMKFKKVSECQCKHMYRIDFKRKDGSIVTAFAYIDGWNFAGKKSPQRAPGDLIRHIGGLFGIPRGQFGLK